MGLRQLFTRSSKMMGVDLMELIRGGKSEVTKNEALNIPSLVSCVNFIANTIAMLPIELRNRQDNKAVLNDKRVWLLNDVTGDTLDAFQMKKAWIRDMLLDGEGYIHIQYNLNKVNGLFYVPSSKVGVFESIDPIFKSYDIRVNGVVYRDFEFLKLTRDTENGVTGQGVIEESNEMLAVAYNALRFENNLVRSGGKKGFLQTDSRVDDATINKIKAAWNKFYSKNSENVMVLNNGLKFTEAALSSVEMQLRENKEANAIEICKMFNLSPQIVDGTCTDEEYNNGIKSAVLPVIKAIETALNKDLLLESEYKSLYFSVDTKSLLKGDMKKRFEAYAIAVNKNILQIDEVREMEGQPPLGLDFIKLGLQDVMYFPETKEIYTPNTKEWYKLEGGEKNNEG